MADVEEEHAANKSLSSFSRAHIPPRGHIGAREEAPLDALAVSRRAGVAEGL